MVVAVVTKQRKGTLDRSSEISKLLWQQATLARLYYLATLFIHGYLPVPYSSRCTGPGGRNCLQLDEDGRNTDLARGSEAEADVYRNPVAIISRNHLQLARYLAQEPNVASHEEILDLPAPEEFDDTTTDNCAGSPTLEDIPALFQDLRLDDLYEDEEFQDPGCLDSFEDR
ncbi:hypothetical protein ARMSODRAFT_1016411 [Armillaria solidipes]|uniref:Uncharacterized protein n=1 Tax=Armillaria solidipes TaxID=1076256 RepID=A0A2H3BS60_9AGAR|nr:hypothetical protein ARMSODRAFT_1016411 [Armillaria solidipes]